jgi:hypothetical protein
MENEKKPARAPISALAKLYIIDTEIASRKYEPEPLVDAWLMNIEQMRKMAVKK